jgi:AcrR family transcriptional regulator
MRYSSLEMPKKLAESAFNLFAERGINAITMDDIAANAEVTKGSLYWHFKSKKEITEAAATHYYQSWYTEVNLQLSKIADPYKRLRRVIEFSVKTCLLDERNRVFTLEILTYSLFDKPMRNSWAMFYNGVREFYIVMVNAAKTNNQLKTKDARLAVDMMLASMEGIKQRALFEPHICTKAEGIAISDALMKVIDEF